MWWMLHDTARDQENQTVNVEEVRAERHIVVCLEHLGRRWHVLQQGDVGGTGAGGAAAEGVHVGAIHKEHGTRDPWKFSVKDRVLEGGFTRPVHIPVRPNRALNACPFLGDETVEPHVICNSTSSSVDQSMM